MARPIQKPSLVQKPALCDAASAPTISPLRQMASTFDAFTIPTTPNGRQQNIITSIDSTSHVLGHNTMCPIGCS